MTAIENIQMEISDLNAMCTHYYLVFTFRSSELTEQRNTYFNTLHIIACIYIDLNIHC